MPGCGRFSPSSGTGANGSREASKPASAYANLIHIPGTSADLRRVFPGEEEISLLYLKLAAKTDGIDLGALGIAGSPMPIAGAALADDELALIRACIRGGAPERGVVAGAVGALGCEANDADVLPNKIPPLPAPAADEGVQMYSGAWSLPSESEDEVCFVNYYDFTDQIPDSEKIPCPELYGGAELECFTYKEVLIAQDPQSHHAVIEGYIPPDDAAEQWAPTSEVWKNWICLGGENDGRLYQRQHLIAFDAIFAMGVIPPYLVSAQSDLRRRQYVRTQRLRGLRTNVSLLRHFRQWRRLRAGRRRHHRRRNVCCPCVVLSRPPNPIEGSETRLFGALWRGEPRTVRGSGTLLTVDRNGRRRLHVGSAAAAWMESVIGCADRDRAQPGLIASDGGAAVAGLRVGCLRGVCDRAAIGGHAYFDVVAVEVEHARVDIDEVADRLCERTDQDAREERAPVLRHAACAADAARTSNAACTSGAALAGHTAFTAAACRSGHAADASFIAVSTAPPKDEDEAQGHGRDRPGSHGGLGAWDRLRSAHDPAICVNLFQLAQPARLREVCVLTHQKMRFD